MTGKAKKMRASAAYPDEFGAHVAKLALDHWQNHNELVEQLLCDW